MYAIHQRVFLSMKGTRAKAAFKEWIQESDLSAVSLTPELLTW